MTDINEHREFDHPDAWKSRRGPAPLRQPRSIPALDPRCAGRPHHRPRRRGPHRRHRDRRSIRPTASFSNCASCSRSKAISPAKMSARSWLSCSKTTTARGRKILTVTTSNRSVRPRTDGQARYVQAMRDNDLVFAIGPAGTGKTYLAVGMAVNHLRQNLVKRIVLVRPAVEAGERLGFLAGRHRRQDQSVSAALARCSQRHDGARAGQALHGKRHHRDRAAGLHARPHAQQRGHHSRRRPKHDRRRK